MTESMPLVSIIIVNYNGERFLERCLSSLLSSNYPNFEVIFVDNASINGSVKLVKNYLNSVSHKLINNPKNLGHAEGCNTGARVARGKYVVFLDNDTEVRKNWLKELVKVMESDPGIGAAQSTLLLDSCSIWATGECIVRLGWAFLESYLKKTTIITLREIFSAISAALIVRRDALEEIGGFDADFFVYYDDVDLCWRLRLRGYKVVVAHSMVYHKFEKKPLGRRTILFHYVKNNFLILIKNYELGNLCRYLPLTMMSRLFFAIKKEFTLPTIKAFLWIILNFKKVWLKRLTVQHFIRNTPDSVVVQHMLPVNIFPAYVAHWFFHYRCHPKLQDFQFFLNRVLTHLT